MIKKIILTICLFVPLSLFGMQYNFLNNPQIIDSTVKLLKSEGINQENIDVWLKLVEEYNSRIDFFTSTKSGWKKSDNPADFYNPKTSLLKGLYVNCRIALFTLIKDMVSVDKYTRNSTTPNHLKHEIEDMHEIFSIGESEENVYKSIFCPVDLPVSQLSDESFDTALKFFKTWWVKEGIHFPENPHLKIMQFILIKPQNKIAFTDHVGLIITNEKGIYLLEKLSPFSPFIISLHSSYQEMGEYLSSTFSDHKDTAFMVLANDEIVWKKIY